MDVTPSQRRLSPAARDACAAWFGPEPPDVGPLPGGGFSGATIVRVRPRGTEPWFVLKSFAAGTSRDRAAWVHACARHIAAAGVAEVPAPIETPSGSTVATDARGVHWELVPFVAGAATETPTVAQACAALLTLARVHVAAATMPGTPPRVGPSPGITHRITRARHLLHSSWHARRAAAKGTAIDAFTAAVGERLDRAITVFDAADGARALECVAATPVIGMLLQPVLRDVWSAHVLFAVAAPERVAGIVDLHAADVDSPATDVARLLGSWRRADRPRIANPAAAWSEALDAYASVRPLQPHERGQVPFFHAAGVVCGLDNWIRWAFEERRAFANPAAVLARIDALLADLPAALEWLGRTPPGRV